MMVYICTKFHENILNGISVMEQTQRVNGRRDKTTFKGNSVENVDGVTVLFLCTSSDGGLYFYKVS